MTFRRSSLKLALIVVALPFAIQTAFADNYAIVMGVSDYATGLNKLAKEHGLDPVKPSEVDLAGAVNDVNDFSQLLKDKFHIQRDHLMTHVNSDASSQSIIEDLKDLAGKTVPGDNVLFYFSGHGTRYPSKDDPNSFDEAIVLGDATVAMDKDIRAIADDFTQHGINMTFVFDSCYSGGMSKGALFYKGSPIVAHRKSIQQKLGQALAKSSVTAKGLTIKATKQDANGTSAFLFASGKDETASDIDFKDPSKQSHGLFTMLLMLALDDQPAMGIKEAVDLVGQAAKEAHFTQTPSVETSVPERQQQPLLP